jgi:hypothetical protein
MIKRVYLKDGKPTLRKTDRLIGYLDEHGIIVPYQKVEIDSQTTTYLVVDEGFAERVDKKTMDLRQKKLQRNVDIN